MIDPRDAVMLLLEAEEGAIIVGRTLLQKKMYFASELVKVDFGFRPHYYGPYSQTIADAVNSLVTNGFVKESVETFPGDSSVFGERRRHSYSLTGDGQNVLRAIGSQPQLEEWRVAFAKVNSHPVAKDFDLLSVAAKIHLIVKAKGKVSEGEILKQAKAFGWDISPPDIDKVSDYLVGRLGILTMRRRSSQQDTTG